MENANGLVEIVNRTINMVDNLAFIQDKRELSIEETYMYTSACRFLTGYYRLIYTAFEKDQDETPNNDGDSQTNP